MRFVREIIKNHLKEKGYIAKELDNIISNMYTHTHTQRKRESQRKTAIWTFTSGKQQTNFNNPTTLYKTVRFRYGKFSFDDVLKCITYNLNDYRNVLKFFGT